MKLSQLLVPEMVLLPIEAGDKWQAIARLARVPVDCGRLSEALLPTVEAALVARERSMTTGMERGIAIPHAAVDDVADTLAVLGISRDGVPFEALDDQPARIIVCLVIPRAAKLLHIKTLAAIAKLLSRDDVRVRLLACKTPAEVLQVVAEGE